MSQIDARERALRLLADLCANGNCQPAVQPPQTPGCSGSSSSDLSEYYLSSDPSAAHRSAPVSPSGSVGSPVLPRAPLVRPTEIKRRNRKRQVPGETQTDLRRIARRAKARQNAHQRVQQEHGGILYCHACGTTETPEWRRGPDGTKSLCNACGLHYAKIVRVERERTDREPSVAPTASAPVVLTTGRIAVASLLNDDSASLLS